MSNGMILARAEPAIPAAEIMTGLNRILYRKIPERMFTALCLVLLDTRSGTLELANAGLCEPLHTTGAMTSYLESPGARVPLGVFPDTQYQSRSLILQPGDALVLYTDGVPEARTTTSELYGYEALQALVGQLDTSNLPAARIKEAIIEDSQRFHGSVRQQDDLTVVVVTRLAIPNPDAQSPE